MDVGRGRYLGNKVLSFLCKKKRMRHLLSHCEKKIIHISGPSEPPGTPGKNPRCFLDFYILSHATSFPSVRSGCRNVPPGLRDIYLEIRMDGQIQEIDIRRKCVIPFMVFILC